MEIINTPQITSQQTVGGRTRYILETEAINKRFAERKARSYLRRELDSIVRIRKSSVEFGDGEKEQSTLDQFSPDILDQKTYVVDLLVTT